MNRPFKNSVTGLLIVSSMTIAIGSTSQAEEEFVSLLTVKQLMNSMLTPMTNTIWGAYELETEAQWKEMENAALGVISVGNLLSVGGAGEGESAFAGEQNWQQYNEQMIHASRQVLLAVENKDEEALSSAGNDLLYPPCESCHTQFQKR